MSSITDNQRKWTVVILIVFGVIVFTLGLRRLSFATRAPFLPLSESGEENLTEADRLKAKDTDKDGLNDYDELYVYNTSPYLEDSDSDGETDREEVVAGNDPNCPGSQNCYGALVELEEDSGTAAVEENLPSTLGGLEGDEINLRDVLLENPLPQEVREILIAEGAPPDEVNALSDEEILSIYREAYNDSSP